MVREPQAHVVSQYFHCRESNEHRSLARMMPPTLDRWLEAWAAVRAASPPEALAPSTPKTDRYKCYNPIDRQRRGLAGCLDCFAVVGLLEEFSKSACLLSSSMHGALPPSCNCSGGGGGGGGGGVSIGGETWGGGGRRARHLSERHEATRSRRGGVDGVRADVRLLRASHGVKHHGGSFQATPRQLELIANLTARDRVLYAAAKER